MRKITAVAILFSLSAVAASASAAEVMTCSYEVRDQEVVIAFRQTTEGLYVKPRREADKDWLRIWDGTREPGKRALEKQAIEVWSVKPSVWRIRDNKGPAGYLLRFDYLRSWIRVQDTRPTEGWCIPGEHLSNS